MKDSIKQHVALGIAASVCIFLLHYTILLLFKLLDWTFTQPLYVRAGTVSIIVGSAVFVLCVAVGWIHDE